MNEIHEFDFCYKIGKYKISSMCYQSYPCQHYVDDGTNVKMMSGVEIYRMLHAENLSHEHFDKYKDIHKTSWRNKKINRNKLSICKCSII